MIELTGNKFTISYPVNGMGTEKSEITFHTGTPDLVSVFNPGSAENKGKRLFITDATVASLDCLKNFVSLFDDGKCGKDYILVLGSGEKYKTINTVLEIIKTGLEYGLNRNDTFIGIGGGVICDITAFAASIFKRGIAVELVPTTLLAMVDASIGGKTGCDFEDYKNMIGSFYPARKLDYFPEFVQSLPDNQYRSGLGEALKTGLLFDKDLFGLFKNESENIKKRDSDTIDKMIRACVACKASIVEKDMTEKGDRAFLNLGHTFGHAYETLCGLGNVAHGDAVAWGIGRMACFCAHKEYCHESYKDEILHTLELYGWETKAIPANVLGGGFGERFIEIMRKDKKNNSDTIRLVLQKGLCENFAEEVSEEDILYVLK